MEQVLDVSNNAQTSNEMNVYFRLVKMRNRDNYVQGVHWKDIVDFLKISKSGYYHSIVELEKKGYIKRLKLNRYDTDIIIIDDEFQTMVKNIESNTNHDQYINLNMKIFNDKEFYNLKANEKRFILHLLKRYTPQNKGKIKYNPGEELEVYAEYLKVDRLPEGEEKKNNAYRCIKKYYKHIKKWISVSPDILVNGEVKRFVTILQGTIDLSRRCFTQSGKLKESNIYAEYDCQEHILKTFLRRSKINYDDQNLADTAWLVRQYKNRLKKSGRDIYDYVKEAILMSLDNCFELTSKAVNNILSNICEKIDKKAAEKKEASTEALPTLPAKEKKSKNSRFNNLDQREYDYELLEKQLLNFGSNEITEF